MVRNVTGNAQVRTTFGPVVLSAAGSNVEVTSQNGSVEVSLPPREKGPACARVAVKTSFGPMRVSLPPEKGYSVEARTSFGKIESELPLTVSGRIGADALSGRSGDGACAVSLVNSNGSISILSSAARAPS